MVRDMTEGRVLRQLAGFSAPLVLGNLLQMAYNAVDSIIVGRFAGRDALAAVGTADPVMNLLILGVSGLCIGASVLMSEAFGARNPARLRRCFASVLYLGAGFSALGAAMAFKAGSPLRLTRAELRPDGETLRLTLTQGGVTALQQACQPMGKLLIQRCVNGLGVEAMAVFNAVGRVDEIVLTPERCISSAMMTFVSQNRGAHRPDRMRQGLARGMLLELCSWAAFFCIVLPLRLPVMRLFVGQDAAAAALGGQYLFCMSFFYLVPGITNGLQGYFRGLGEMRITLLGSITQISVRTLCVWWWTPYLGLVAVAWASLAGWCCMLALELPLLRLENHRL